jgi:ribonuclease P protein component
MRLRTRQQYQRMTQKTYTFTGQWILANVRLSSGPYSRLGITATKRYGAAYQRNRFKRIVREAFRLLYPHFKFAFDIVIRPRSQALKAKMADIQQELLSFLEKISHLRDKENSQDLSENE